MGQKGSSLAAALADRYAIERELGRGGMATVYLAHDRKHNRPVALKVLRPDLAATLGSDRFRREIETAARLQHPHICSVYDSGETAGQLWFTMPYVRGESLRDRLRREGRLTIEETLRITGEAGRALDYAHREGFVHRDVKPENLLITREGDTLVADFGIARALADPGTGGQRLTETGLALGTSHYMAPEQATGDRAVDARADQYALAATCYEMLTGEPPFSGPTAAAIVAERFRRPAPSVREHRPDVPPVMDETIRRALALEPGARFATTDEFVRTLASAGIVTVPMSVPEGPKSLWLPFAVLGTPLLAIVAALAFIAHRYPGFLERETSAPPIEPALSRVAVLPFENRGDSADAYFAEGMGEELTTALTKVPGLRVAAPSLVSGYRRRRAPVDEMARALHVGAILTGTIRRAGDQLRVTAQLTNSTDGTVLWAERYDRNPKDVFAVEDEIAGAIANELHARVAGAAAAGPSRSPGSQPGTADLEAYDLYLKGRFAWSKRGTKGLRDAIDYFGSAVARDPGFARGHAGLAMAYIVLPIFDAAFPMDSALVLSERSAHRALALDSTLSDAHLALAYILKMRWRFPEAEREFRSALALAPDDPAVHHWYGVFLYAVGRASESVEQVGRARELDPFGPTIAIDGALALYSAGRYDEALAESRRGWMLDSTRSDNFLEMGFIQLARGRADSAASLLEHARRLGVGIDVRGYLSAAYRALGRVREADVTYAELRADERAGRAAPYFVALAATAAGDRDAALAAIDRTVGRRDQLVTEISMPCEAVFRPLAPLPRFQAALAKAGMQACSTGRSPA
jgi:TolB-like protein/Flp pilus assembly protein TadD/predicted Ser/Thr protein kinase